MPKPQTPRSNKRQSFPSSSSSCFLLSSNGLTAVLILLGGLTIGVDVFFLTQTASARRRRRQPSYLKLQAPPYDDPVHLEGKSTPARMISQSNTTTSIAAAAPDNDKSAVLRILQQAGLPPITDPSILQQLPTLAQVHAVWGTQPVIVGLDSCTRFQQQVPEIRRMLGAAGMFSTGTNLVTQLLKKNCVIPARLREYGANASKEQLGVRWQVPWGKHTDAMWKDQHATSHAQDIAKDDLLPVVTIRNVWTWMQSMCHHPYAAHWEHTEQCPNLLRRAAVVTASSTVNAWNNVTVTYGAGPKSYPSLLHLWNDWYGAYLYNASFPRLVVRMEDLVFHTQSTIDQICQCVGGHLVQGRPFQYVHESAKKDSPGHDTRTGYVEAWIKYSRPLAVEAGFAHDDFRATLEGVDQRIMDLFGYLHPPLAASSEG